MNSPTPKPRFHQKKRTRKTWSVAKHFNKNRGTAGTTPQATQKIMWRVRSFTSSGCSKGLAFFSGLRRGYTYFTCICMCIKNIYIYVYLCVPATVMEVPKNYSSQKLERSLRGSDASGQGDVFLNSPRSLEEWPCTQFRMDGCFIHGLEDIERHHHILRFRVQYPVLV